MNPPPAGRGQPEIQVVVPAGVQGPLREWLASRGLYLFPIPVEDDLPTFGIGIEDCPGRKPKGKTRLPVTLACRHEGWIYDDETAVQFAWCGECKQLTPFKVPPDL